MKPLTQAWLIHDRINRAFIEAISPEGWPGKASKAKDVSNQFAHIHNVRLMWLKSIDQGLVEGVSKAEATLSREEICDLLRQSAAKVAGVIDEAVAKGGRVKNFKPSVEAFVLYLVSHESNHRAMAELALRQLGHPISEKAAYGQWEWGSRLSELEKELA